MGSPTTIRAKLRCLRLTETWDGMSIVGIAPVLAGFEHSKENKAFWSATPTGEGELIYKGKAPFVPGSYYYFDMVAVVVEARARNKYHGWTLDKVTFGEADRGNGEVSFSVYASYDPDAEQVLTRGTLKLGIEFQETLELFGKPGPYDIVITPAGD